MDFVTFVLMHLTIFLPVVNVFPSQSNYYGWLILQTIDLCRRPSYRASLLNSQLVNSNSFSVDYLV